LHHRAVKSELVSTAIQACGLDYTLKDHELLEQVMD
jgi:hypothetical protein